MANTIRVLVGDKLADDGLALLRSTPGVEVDIRLGLEGAALAEALASADGLIVRSKPIVTAEALAKPGKLRAIVRAGVGVDNVDLDAATAGGILVMNTPDANTISTAEHTLAMLLALSRQITTADQLVHAGKFAEGRKSCIGSQLAGKTLGIIGMGRIGRAVAQRALGFDMTVVGFDTFVSTDSLFDGRVRMVRSLDDLLPIADFITIHTTLSDQTRHMIAKPQLERMKPSVRLVNVARGGLYHEYDLAAALNSGRIAGAALDVFEQEPPPADHPLLTARNLVLTPHLGASTEEAQVAVSVEAVQLLLNFLLKDEIRSAVNVAGLPGSFSERDRHYVDLTRRLGMIAARLLPGRIQAIRLDVHGSGLEKLAAPMSRFATIELLRPCVVTPPNLINVDLFAQQYGFVVSHSMRHAGAEGAEKLVLTVDTDGGVVEVEGALYLSVNRRPHLLSVSGYPMDMVPAGPVLMVFNHDEPGVVGVVGTLLGRAKVNIADMTLSRQGDKAMMLLKVDAPIPEPVMQELTSLPSIRHAHQLTLPPLLA